MSRGNLHTIQVQACSDLLCSSGSSILSVPRLFQICHLILIIICALDSWSTASSCFLSKQEEEGNNKKEGVVTLLGKSNVAQKSSVDSFSYPIIQNWVKWSSLYSNCEMKSICIGTSLPPMLLGRLKGKGTLSRPQATSATPTDSIMLHFTLKAR